MKGLCYEVRYYVYIKYLRKAKLRISKGIVTKLNKKCKVILRNNFNSVKLKDLGHILKVLDNSFKPGIYQI